MQSNNYIEAKDILSATNGGLDIIFQLYPQAIGSDVQPTRKFKLHEEKTASASLKKADDGNWLVTNFGDDSKPRNGIQCFAKENNLDFVEALRELAVLFNVVSEERKAELIRADYKEVPAAPEDIECQWEWNIRDKSQFTDIEVETIISKKILSKLGWKGQDEAKAKVAADKINNAFQEYHWHPLISYSLVKGRKKMTFSANEKYPMFLIDEGAHQKIYQPKHSDKGRRFMYAGEKPKDFIHGLVQLNQAYEENVDRIEDEKNAAKEAKDRGNSEPTKMNTDPKLKEVVLCTGGSDAINVALMGYRVIWLNSETAKLHQWQYDKIAAKVHKFYQLPDIDATGRRAAHELNMLYLDMYWIELPEELLKFRDSRGNPCKDVRDYLNHYRTRDFRKLVEMALPYRFWEKRLETEGKGEDKVYINKYQFDGVQAFNFLAKNGFGRLKLGDKKTDWMYIRQVGNVIYETDADQIQDFIHDFLEERQFDKELRNQMLFTSRLNNTTLTRLKFRDIDFTNYTRDTQLLFFTNYTIEITADDIVYHKPGSVDRYIWDDEVLQHRVVKADQPPFTITKDEHGAYDIEIHNYNCPYMQYLVQVSRVHWRLELETRMAQMTPLERDAYLAQHKCTIAGPNLNDDEIDEQKQHLINKIFTTGFLLHRYKARNKPWFVWAQDNKINDDGKSHGGSGKSIMMDMAVRAILKKGMTLNGRNSKLNDDQFKYDGVTEHTPYLLVDDAHEYLKLDPFYKDISGDMNVNPKGKTPFTIPYENSPKMGFTSNYTPRDLGPSTERRMVYTAFSDYYHNKGETDDYNEARDPSTDLGMTLFTDFDHGQWNSFYQVMMHCIKFYLGTSEKIKPAMGNVNKRNLLAEMDNLHDWALVYFSEESGRLDSFVVREEAQRDYKRFNGKEISPQKYLSRLQAFCRYYGYVLNPKQFQNKDKKIIKKTERKIYIEATGDWEVIQGAQKVAKEMFYLQTKNELMEHPDQAGEDLPETPVTPADGTPGKLSY